MASPFESNPVINPKGKTKISFGLIKLKNPEDKIAEGETEAEPVAIGGFSSFSFTKPSSSGAVTSKSGEDAVDEDEAEMNRVMGFSNFETSKKEVLAKKSARNFDVKEMAEAIRKSKIKEREDKTVGEIQILPSLAEANDDEEVEDPESSHDDDESQDGTLALLPSVSKSTKKADSDDDDEGLSSYVKF